MYADYLHSFLIEGTRVRGRLLQLHEVWREVQRRGRYEPTEAQILGQALAATGLLSAVLKGEGRLTLQVRGEGPLGLLVTQFAAPDGLRGLVQSNEPLTPGADLPGLFGPAQLALTLEPPNARERYQGLVDLSGVSLAEALADYFQRSEQLPTQFWLAVDEHVAAGLMLQRLPGDDDDPDAWDRSLHLAMTINPDELLLTDPMHLLRRVFAGETLRLFEPASLRFACACSRERSQAMLAGLGIEELGDILREQGDAEVRCEFCNARYLFDTEDLQALLDALRNTH